MEQPQRCVITQFGRSCLDEAPVPRIRREWLLAYAIGRVLESVLRHAWEEREALRTAGDDPALAFT